MSNFESFDRKIINMSTMLTRLGIDPAVPRYGSLFRKAIGDCQACSAGEVCRDWLARAGERFEHPPAFCPNAHRFELAKTVIVPAKRPT